MVPESASDKDSAGRSGEWCTSMVVDDDVDSDRAGTRFAGLHMSHAVSQRVTFSRNASQRTGTVNVHDADVAIN